jgi:hypothetical protein
VQSGRTRVMWVGWTGRGFHGLVITTHTTVIMLMHVGSLCANGSISLKCHYTYTSFYAVRLHALFLDNSKHFLVKVHCTMYCTVNKIKYIDQLGQYPMHERLPTSTT